MSRVGYNERRSLPPGCVDPSGATSYTTDVCSVLGFCRDGDVRAIVLLAGEDDLAVDECVERVVLTDPDACTWVMLSTTLADDDVTSLGVLTTEEFYSESLTF